MKTIYLYIIGAKPTGPLKIGVSYNLDLRLCAIQTGSHLDLSIIKKWSLHPSGAYRIETIAHNTLGEFRLKGEWFSCSPEVAIKEIDLILCNTKKGKDFTQYEEVKNVNKCLASILGGKRNAAKWKDKVKGGIEKARSLWVLPSKQHSIRDIEEISGIARGTIVRALGNRVPAQIAHQAAQKRKERRNAKR